MDSIGPISLLAVAVLLSLLLCRWASSCVVESSPVLLILLLFC